MKDYVPKGDTYVVMLSVMFHFTAGIYEKLKALPRPIFSFRLDFLL
jgi:hypothetical protein